MHVKVGTFSKHALIYYYYFFLNISDMINIYINTMLKHNTQPGDSNKS